MPDKRTRIIGAVLIWMVAILPASPAALGHAEPPKAVIEIGPGGSLKLGDPANVKVNLVGGLSGAPLTGARIRVTPVGPAAVSAPPPFELGPGEQPGFYRGQINLSAPGRWRLEFEIEHRGEIDRKMVELDVSQSGGASPQEKPSLNLNPVRTEQNLGLAEHEEPRSGLENRWLWAGGALLVILAAWSVFRRAAGKREDRK